MNRVRPNALRWTWYALGGRLPDKHKTWVLHDITTKTWIWRHAARATVMISPLVVVWLLLPAPLDLRLAIMLMAALVGYFYSFAYIDESCEYRLSKHGYAHG